ncbi:hypothetical protein EM858_04320 [Agrobacterium sp. CNPSo 2736]|uniref:hypothetical protein n=1 Tax=Agrobacterium sp. CNPSo 2736 TaxID=2499627 RepID=UPI000FDB9F95|nr:hypothetical protein [Agrobacterium sp. CNPSo 2736]RVT80227.1 hypothetical protein EM858_04320 [Agrobacterium sp. CNPSo 2736]
MPLTAAEVFRDFESDGIPSSGAHQPKKADIRTLLKQYETVIGAFTSNGGLVYASKVLLDADLAHASNSMAWVIGDGTPSNNGIYMKVGASGAGSWSRVADLPYSFIIAEDEGDGTPNAIQATSSLPVVGSALVLLNIFETNTASPVTISFNGAAPLTIKSNSGNDIAPVGLQAGMLVMGRVSGSTFRLVSDQVSAAIIAEAESILAQVEAIRDIVVGAVPNTFSSTRAALKALDTGTITSSYLKESGREGQFLWRSGDYSAEIAADPQEGLYIKADGVAATAGAWVRQGGWAVSGVNVQWFGAVGDGVVDDTVAVQAAIDIADVISVPRGLDVRLTETVNVNRPVTIIGKGCAPHSGFTTDNLTVNVRGTGSWFFLDHAGVGFDVRPEAGATAFSLARFAGCGTYRDQPTPSGSSFVPGAFDFDFDCGAVEIELNDFVALNPTKFFRQRASGFGRFRMVGVRGQPLSVGIDIDNIYDCCHIDTVHFWTYWAHIPSSVWKYQCQNLTTLKVGRCDGLRISSLFSIFQNVGLHIVPTEGTEGGTLFRAHADLLYMDLATYGILVADNADNASIEIVHLIANGDQTVAGEPSTKATNGISVIADGVQISIGMADFVASGNSAVSVSGANSRVQISRPVILTQGRAFPGAAVAFFAASSSQIILDGELKATDIQGVLYGGAGYISSPDWRSYAPGVASSSGAIAGASASGSYRIHKGVIEVRASATITNNGTGAGALHISTPIQISNTSIGVGRENALTGKTLSVTAAGGTTHMAVANYDNTYPAATGASINVNVSWRL